MYERFNNLLLSEEDVPHNYASVYIKGLFEMGLFIVFIGETVIVELILVE